MSDFKPGDYVQYQTSWATGNTGVVVDPEPYQTDPQIDYSDYTFVLWDVTENVSPIETKFLVHRPHIKLSPFSKKFLKGFFG